MSRPASHTDFNYLMLSDVHLGSDLVQHSAPWTAHRLAAPLPIDHELATMLEHYQKNADPERPWKLVLAGDVIDLVGMSISPDEADALELTDDERRHGLGGSRRGSAIKMRAVVRRHARFFTALATFVADGHHVVFVRGNHDVELYWSSVRKVFRQALVEHSDGRLDRSTVKARVSFRHWFYYEEGFVYVEHGHQYDETCAYHHVLAPLSPDDPERLSYSFSDILLRYIVRPTRGLSSDGHENQSMLDYLRMAISMGLWGCAELAYRFFRAIGRMFKAWRAHTSERVHAIRQEHERQMHRVAQRLRLSIDQVRAIASFGATPVTGGFFRITRSVFLDGLVAIATVGLTLLIVGLFDLVPVAYLPLLALAIGVPLLLWMKSSTVFDPGTSLTEGARKVASLLPARFIVMGHTHVPKALEIVDGVTYFNLGFWAGDSLETMTGPPAPRSHLVLRFDGVTHRAELLGWHPERGPEVLDTHPVSGVHPVPSAPRSGPNDGANRQAG